MTGARGKWTVKPFLMCLGSGAVRPPGGETGEMILDFRGEARTKNLTQNINGTIKVLQVLMNIAPQTSAGAPVSPQTHLSMCTSLCLLIISFGSQSLVFSHFLCVPGAG